MEMEQMGQEIKKKKDWQRSSDEGLENVKVKKYLFLHRFFGSRQNELLFSTCCEQLSGALFSNESAPAFHLRLQKQMNSEHRFCYFSKSYWELHFSYGFGMTSSCYNTCDLTKFQKLHDIQFHLICPQYFNSFMLA